MRLPLRLWETARFPGRVIVAAGTAVTAQSRTDAAWGPSGTRERPTGLGIVNLRTREVIIAARPERQWPWHVSGSPDGRWAVGDDFSRSIFFDRIRVK